MQTKIILIHEEALRETGLENQRLPQHLYTNITNVQRLVNRIKAKEEAGEEITQAEIDEVQRKSAIAADRIVTFSESNYEELNEEQEMAEQQQKLADLKAKVADAKSKSDWEGAKGVYNDILAIDPINADATAGIAEMEAKIAEDKSSKEKADKDKADAEAQAQAKAKADAEAKSKSGNAMNILFGL